MRRTGSRPAQMTDSRPETTTGGPATCLAARASSGTEWSRREGLCGYGGATANLEEASWQRQAAPWSGERKGSRRHQHQQQLACRAPARPPRDASSRPGGAAPEPARDPAAARGAVASSCVAGGRPVAVGIWARERGQTRRPWARARRLAWRKTGSSVSASAPAVAHERGQTAKGDDD